jgi:hypothetical protein
VHDPAEPIALLLRARIRDRAEENECPHKEALTSSAPKQQTLQKLSNSLSIDHAETSHRRALVLFSRRRWKLAGIASFVSMSRPTPTTLIDSRNPSIPGRVVMFSSRRHPG